MDEDTGQSHWWRIGPREIREAIRQNNLMYGGLVGVAVLMVQPFLTAGPTDLPATISVVSFAVAIPLLAGLILVTEQEKFRGHASRSKMVEVARSLAILASIVGLVAGFWHMSWIAGVVVLISMAAAVAFHSAGYTRVEELNRASSERGEGRAEDHPDDESD